MIAIGLVLLVAAIIALIVGFILVVVASVIKNTKMRTVAGYLLAGAGISLLVSFAFCSLAR